MRRLWIQMEEHKPDWERAPEMGIDFSFGAYMTWFGCHEFFFSTGSASRVVRADGICYLRFYISLSALLLGLVLLLLFTVITCWGSLGRLIEDRGSGRRLPKFGPRQFPTPLFVHPPQLRKTNDTIARTPQQPLRVAYFCNYAESSPPYT